MAKVLVTGGCGYIGSHTIVDLLDKGFEVISVDNLMNSDLSAIDGIESITGKKITNYTFDLCNLARLRRLFIEHPDIDSVIHFAALKSVKESVDKPYLYFRNNLNSLINLLECCKEFELTHFIFSSSCTVYGNPEKLPVNESTPIKKAESPYGKTKQISEDLINSYAANSNLKAILLRYFNPAGAHESNQIGESPINPALNLVPVITETAFGLRESMTIFGKDYPTRDGTNIRDYIHIMDLAEAHTLALQYLVTIDLDTGIEVFNLGIGEGVSVLEAVKAFEEVAGVPLNYQFGPRRDGDVIAIYSDYEKARKVLNWSPKRTINDIMRTAWNWEQKRRNSE